MNSSIDNNLNDFKKSKSVSVVVIFYINVLWKKVSLVQSIKNCTIIIANITSGVASCTVLGFFFFSKCVLYSFSFVQALFYKLILMRVHSLHKHTETIHSDKYLKKKATYVVFLEFPFFIFLNY